MFLYIFLVSNRRRIRFKPKIFRKRQVVVVGQDIAFGVFKIKIKNSNVHRYATKKSNFQS